MSNRSSHHHQNAPSNNHAANNDAVPVTHSVPANSYAEQDIPTSVDVPVGTALPSSAAHQLPTLKAPAAQVNVSGAELLSTSLIAEGVNFVGNAQLQGVCSVGGRVEGNLVQSAGANITVIVTESGHVKGDIIASTISIMGQTEGLLDATGGSVTLHDASRVTGHVRYNRIQVNGADLNATLEKATGSQSGQAPASKSTNRQVGNDL